MAQSASLFYFRTIVTMGVIVSALMLLYLFLVQYVIAPQVPYTQDCNGYIRDQDPIMSLEGQFLTLRGETLFIHDIACLPY